MSEVISSGGRPEMVGNSSALSSTLEVEGEMYSDWAGWMVLSELIDSRISCGREISAHAIEAWNLGLS